jgi:hypothetical protein
MNIHWVWLKNIGNITWKCLYRLFLVYCGQVMNTRKKIEWDIAKKRKEKNWWKMVSEVKISIQDELRFITAADFQFCKCYFESATS